MAGGSTHLVIREDGEAVDLGGAAFFVPARHDELRVADLRAGKREECFIAACVSLFAHPPVSRRR